MSPVFVVNACDLWHLTTCSTWSFGNEIDKLRNPLHEPARA